MKRLKPEAEVQSRLDDETVLDAVISELERGNPGWKTSLPQAMQDVFDRREARSN
ncbi:MAG: hypothetical protein ACTSV1_02800 [Alphaproteobacteria bacterium]